uniref:Uncharacterized protein n=1 Tax=Cercocebus atys TaxID=9531 RepID=A0A2K5NDX5_CERAT
MKGGGAQGPHPRIPCLEEWSGSSPQEPGVPPASLSSSWAGRGSSCSSSQVGPRRLAHMPLEIQQTEAPLANRILELGGSCSEIAQFPSQLRSHPSLT